MKKQVGETGLIERPEGYKPTRKERAEETRARLVHAAVTLFSERGYHETTVQMISERAGVAKGTFFVHFATKDILLAGVIANYIAHAQVAREAAVRTGAAPKAAIRALLSSLAEQAGRSAPMMRALYAATLANTELASATRSLYDMVKGVLVEEMVRGQRDGTFRADIGAHDAAWAIASLYVGASFSFGITPEGPPLWVAFEPLLDALLTAYSPVPPSA